AEERRYVEGSTPMRGASGDHSRPSVHGNDSGGTSPHRRRSEHPWPKHPVIDRSTHGPGESSALPLGSVDGAGSGRSSRLAPTGTLRPHPNAPHRRVRAVAVTGDAADRELLFEALAVHLGFVSRRAVDELAAGRHEPTTWVAARPLGR